MAHNCRQSDLALILTLSLYVSSALTIRALSPWISFKVSIYLANFNVNQRFDFIN